MKRTKYHKKDIFCIEGYWEHDRTKKTSIKKALEFFEEISPSKIKTTCLPSSTIEEFKGHINEFNLKRNKKSGILYLAFHGGPNCLHIGKRKKLKLIDPENFDDLASIMSGSAIGKIIHLGSCSTLNMTRKEISKFRKQTGAAAISGYNKDIEFIESTFLDVLFFEACQRYKVPSSIDKFMKENYRGLINRSGFKMFYEPTKKKNF